MLTELDIMADMAQAEVAKLTPSDITELKALAAAVHDREVEALALYEPLPFQERYHSCMAKECILAKGNQAGGSICGYAEVARAVTGQDPHGKYPERDGIAVCLGYGEGHVGRVIHKYLFRWGAFKIIRDTDTLRWRTYRPWPKDRTIMGRPGDEHRESEARPAPPLIPPRFVEGKLAWKKRSENIFSKATFTTGWELYAFNSVGDPEHGMGFQVDLYHIDEDVANTGWVAEAIARLSIREGLMRWTAMPHRQTDDIVDMIQRAEDEEGSENPRTVVIYAGIDENPYLSENSKNENRRIWRSMGEDEYIRRTEGKLTLSSVRMYPDFAKEIHCTWRPLSSWDLEDEQEGKVVRHPIQKYLQSLNGNIPDHWCKYMSVDPGHTVCAVLLAATPPPQEWGDWRIIYRELYIKRCTAKIFGSELKAIWKPQSFRDFLFDMHGGRLRDLGTGELPVTHYEKALSDHNISCDVRGSRFMAGSDQIEHREMCLRSWLEVRPTGKCAGFPTVLIDMNRCPNLVRELISFKKKIVRTAAGEQILDEGNRKSNTHAVEALEMLAAHGMAYFKPKVAIKQLTGADAILKMKQQWKQRRESSGSQMYQNGGIVLGAQGVTK